MPSYYRALPPNFYVSPWLRPLTFSSSSDVHQEGGTHYAETIHDYLYWSDLTSLSNEQRFVERVFDGIVYPTV
ncbi:unnamed protein product [Penicillium camemberti]|uniref:Str. FM013 n=1 Tax=Penicillium camemberti (strain FM 013) TaxID=1429867 RepID=A0A0G4PNR1_PENC3|nr:unnamed protein product [Penicillium camemberti]